MKLKTAAAAVIATVLLMSASGCDFTDFGSENMLRPPKSMGDEAEIEQLIADTAKGDYTLKYPKSGNYRSAIVMTDLDGDGTSEAIAFYREKGNTTSIHMLVMYDDDGSWKLSSDFVTETTDIDCVDFANVDGNGALEIFVGYATYSPNVNFLSCYSYGGGTTQAITAGQNYSAFYCGDLNSDGMDEVVTLSLYSTENEARASMLSYDAEKKSMFAKATVPMDPNVVKYKNVTICDLDNKTKGIVVDGSFASEEINTQVIYYNNELSLLRNPLFKDKTKNLTQRTIPVICADINNDQLYEIPVVSQLPHSGSEGTETVADKIIWNSFDLGSETLVQSVSMVANYDLKYTVKMPEKWQKDTVTALINSENNSTAFYEWKDDELGDELFEIKVFDVASWDKGQNKGNYTIIYKDNKYAYTFVNCNSKSEYELSDEEIKTAFSVLNELII
ncbi:MAG: VCBS repeat-containing protein [Ruminococcus bromii]|nr:VCBS repeat-containing protein [Ruminococcus bromii]